MNSPFIIGAGRILSADIAVPEHERESQFYARVLTTGDEPLWQEDLMNNLGLPVIGLAPRTPEYEFLPLQWMPHIQVADVAASVAAANEMGGTEYMHAKAEDGSSEWAALADPSGAAFGIMPVLDPSMIPPVDASGPMGCISWVDLTVSDAPNIRDFYQRVIGWSVEDVAMEDAGDSYADYNLLTEDGHAAAGLCHARGENSGLPATWLLYLPVGDLTESLRRVEEEGGTTLKTTQGSDGVHTTAVIRDPVGACFALASA